MFYKIDSSLDELFEWLVPPILVQVKKSELFVPFSELHLVNCMIRLLAEVLSIDELVNLMRYIVDETFNFDNGGLMSITSNLELGKIYF